MPRQPQGSVALTPPRALAVAAMFGGLAGWLIAVTTNAFDIGPLRVPWSTPIGLGLVAALVGALAYSTHQRIQVRHERMDPQRAVAFLVLGKASALGGAVVVGGYLAYGLMFLSGMEADGPRERVISSAVTVLAGIALTISGLLLERACKVPGEPDDDSDDDVDDDLGADTRD